MKKVLLSVPILALGLAANAQVYFSDDFGTTTPDISAWTNVDNDGDGNDWSAADVTGNINSTGGSAISNSWISSAGPLTPDNLLISPMIDLTSASGTVMMFWTAGSIESTNNWWEETYSVYVTNSNNVSTIIGTTADFNETLPGGGVMLSRNIDLSSFVGQQVYVTFRHHNCTDENFLVIDDVSVQTVLPDDAGVSALTNAPYAQAGNVNITGEITNYGSNTITAVDLVWTDGTNTYTDNLTGLSLATNDTYSFTHSTPLSVTAGQSYNIDVYTDLTNDGNSSNDQMSVTIGGMTGTTTKIVVGEEATGTWCGWCPRGAVALANMESVNDFIGIAVHNGDPMVVTAYDNGIGGFISGYPSAVTDRVLVDDPSNFMTTYNARINEISPADISIQNVTVSGSTINFDVVADFKVSTTGDFRLNAVITENDVTGTSSGYDQVNYYSFQSQNIALTGAGHDWQADPNPVPAADMEYDHVGRAILGGFNGTSGSVPATVTAGNSYTQSYSYTVPTSQDINNMHIVGMLHNNANGGEILNANKESVITGIEDVEYNFDVNVFPNPTSDMAYITLDLTEASEVKMDIMNISGALVKTNDYGKIDGSKTFIFNGDNLEAGIYFVRITVGTQVLTKRIVLSK